MTNLIKDAFLFHAMRHATCAACPFFWRGTPRLGEGGSTRLDATRDGERRGEREREGRKEKIYIATITRSPGEPRGAAGSMNEDLSRTLCMVVGARLAYTAGETSSTSQRYYYYYRQAVHGGKGDGDKSCDRNDSAKLLLARIRARNCPSLVRLVRLVRAADCAPRPGGGASGTRGSVSCRPSGGRNRRGDLPGNQAMSVIRALTTHASK